MKKKKPSFLEEKTRRAVEDDKLLARNAFIGGGLVFLLGFLFFEIGIVKSALIGLFAMPLGAYLTSLYLGDN